MSRIGKEWWQVIYFAGHLEKVVLKKRYRQIECKKEEICNEIKELRRTV
jgi:RNA-directed DNA polymerase